MPGPEPLRVSIVSSYPCVAAGLTALVHRRPERAVVVETPERSSDVGGQVDVVIFDLAVCGGDAEALVAGRLPVIVYARMREATTEVVQGIGEERVVREDVTSEELLAVVERAAGRHEDRGTGRDDQRADGRDLTPRETDVVRLIASGFSNEEIGRRLVIGANSVKSYIRSACKAMGVGSRTQAVLWAMRHGLVPAPAPRPATPLSPAAEQREERRTAGDA